MGSQRWEVVDTVDSGHRWTWLGASPQKDVWSWNNFRHFKRQCCIIKEKGLASLWWPLDKTVLIWAVLTKLHITSVVNQFFIAKQLIMHMKMFHHKYVNRICNIWKNFPSAQIFCQKALNSRKNSRNLIFNPQSLEAVQVLKGITYLNETCGM